MKRLCQHAVNALVVFLVSMLTDLLVYEQLSVFIVADSIAFDDISVSCHSDHAMNAGLTCHRPDNVMHI